MVRHALITGASSGLGEALAKRLALQGFNLTLNARRLERLLAVRDDIKRAHPKIDIMLAAGDAADKQTCHAMIEKSMNHFKRLDVVVANAGQGMWTRFRDVADPDELLDLMRVNYMGVVYGLYYSLAYLRETRGSFVAVSSIQGVIPVAYHTGYVASKYAVNGFIDTMRLEEPDVHFLLALPSWISGTELRSHALGGIGHDAIRVNPKHGKSAVSAEDCANQIVYALKERDREVYIPRKFSCVPLLRQVAKKTFDRVVLNKVNTQLKDSH